MPVNPPRCRGGITDWLTQRARTQPTSPPPNARPNPEIKSQTSLETNKDGRRQLQKKKLSYKDQRELEALPGRVEALEAEQAELRAALADGSLYQSDLQRAIALQSRDSAIDEELTAALERWAELEAAQAPPD